MKSRIYVVYDKNDNVVGIYASRTWSETRANEQVDWRVVTYKIVEEDN